MMRFLIPYLFLTAAALTGCNPHAPTEANFAEFNTAAGGYVLDASYLAALNSSKCGPLKDFSVPSATARIKEARDLLPEKGKKSFDDYIASASFAKSMKDARSYASGAKANSAQCKEYFVALTTGNLVQNWQQARVKMERMTGW